MVCNGCGTTRSFDGLDGGRGGEGVRNEGETKSSKSSKSKEVFFAPVKKPSFDDAEEKLRSSGKVWVEAAGGGEE
jgi:hypothetical protein